MSGGAELNEIIELLREIITILRELDLTVCTVTMQAYTTRKKDAT